MTGAFMNYHRLQTGGGGLKFLCRAGHPERDGVGKILKILKAPTVFLSLLNQDF